MKSIKKTNAGFTLVETVIAITIIGVIGIIMGDVLKRAFDNTSKTTLISNIQQNGSTALSIIQDTARFSQFVCLGDGDITDADGALSPNLDNIDYIAPILVIFKDARYIRYRIFGETSSANGYIQEDFPTYTGNDATSALCTFGSPTFKMWSADPVTSTNLHVLTNNVSISVKNPKIILLTKPVNTLNGVSKVSVALVFSMAASKNAQNRPQEQLGPNNTIDFNTTIQFRQ